MTSTSNHQITKFRLGSLFRGAVLAACVALAGCAETNLRGDPFPEDDLATLGRQLRQVPGTGPTTAYTNKGIQIEKNLGGAR